MSLTKCGPVGRLVATTRCGFRPRCLTARFGPQGRPYWTKSVRAKSFGITAIRGQRVWRCCSMPPGRRSYPSSLPSERVGRQAESLPRKLSAFERIAYDHLMGMKSCEPSTRNLGEARWLALLRELDEGGNSAG